MTAIALSPEALPGTGPIGPVDANKLAMPKRDRKVRRVDFPNSPRLSLPGVSSLSP